VNGADVTNAPDVPERAGIAQVLEWKPGHGCRDYSGWSRGTLSKAPPLGTQRPQRQLSRRENTLRPPRARRWVRGACRRELVATLRRRGGVCGDLLRRRLRLPAPLLQVLFHLQVRHAVHHPVGRGCAFQVVVEVLL